MGRLESAVEENGEDIKKYADIKAIYTDTNTPAEPARAVPSRRSETNMSALSIDSEAGRSMQATRLVLPHDRQFSIFPFQQ